MENVGEAVGRARRLLGSAGGVEVDALGSWSPDPPGPTARKGRRTDIALAATSAVHRQEAVGRLVSMGYQLVGVKDHPADDDGPESFWAWLNAPAAEFQPTEKELLAKPAAACGGSVRTPRGPEDVNAPSAVDVGSYCEHVRVNYAADGHSGPGWYVRSVEHPAAGMAYFDHQPTRAEAGSLFCECYEPGRHPPAVVGGVDDDAGEYEETLRRERDAAEEARTLRRQCHDAADALKSAGVLREGDPTEDLAAAIRRLAGRVGPNKPMRAVREVQEEDASIVRDEDGDELVIYTSEHKTAIGVALGGGVAGHAVTLLPAQLRETIALLQARLPAGSPDAPAADARDRLRGTPPHDNELPIAGRYWGLVNCESDSIVPPVMFATRAAAEADLERHRALPPTDDDHIGPNSAWSVLRVDVEGLVWNSLDEDPVPPPDADTSRLYALMCDLDEARLVADRSNSGLARLRPLLRTYSERLAAAEEGRDEARARVRTLLEAGQRWRAGADRGELAALFGEMLAARESADMAALWAWLNSSTEERGERTAAQRETGRPSIAAVLMKAAIPTLEAGPGGHRSGVFVGQGTGVGVAIAAVRVCHDPDTHPGDVDVMLRRACQALRGSGYVVYEPRRGAAVATVLTPEEDSQRLEDHLRASVTSVAEGCHWRGFEARLRRHVS